MCSPFVFQTLCYFLSSALCLYFVCVPSGRVFSAGPRWDVQLPWIPEAQDEEEIIRYWKQQQ